ncbi:hypothetical protein HU200_046096 [Digitaria exilis]|uniref:Uncharacterized protein n=1 Tax=Digitaria exilis TaxID=1010633 RepID=A0A835BAJ6_9POAL|nr:hypothetical protein HU200_046096 [Digitaria exilis]
MPASASTGSS